MTEERAATVIASAVRGRIAREGLKASTEIVSRANWGLARAKSRMVMPLSKLLSGSVGEEESTEQSPEDDAKATRAAQRTTMASCPTYAAHQHKLRLKAPRGKLTYHLYCSPSNLGAAELAEELGETLDRIGDDSYHGEAQLDGSNDNATSSRASRRLVAVKDSVRNPKRALKQAAARFRSKDKLANLLW